MNTPLVRWRCTANYCDRMHETEAAAEACCGALVVEVAVCPVCKKTYHFDDAEVHAAACCQPSLPD